ncbi:uncharacterized protein [Nicotiana tomentosiformis]|uniref:uncharacterized protein n=1 Tax=Nicotiana tomentosiformis TaxID=4098 RepID=UPI00388CA6FF
MDFARPSKYAALMLPTVEARVHRFVQGLSPLVINEAATDALNLDCVVTVRGRDTVDDLIELGMLNFDVIMGMDWLHSCFAKLDCRTQSVRFEFPSEIVVKWKRDDVMPKGRFISYLKALKMIKKGCIYHLVWVTDTDAEAPTLESVPVVKEFSEVFPDELPRILPDREIDFGINMMPGTQHISIPPYRIAPAELNELKE